MYEKSLVILKPDAIQRRLVGEIIKKFENVGLKIHGIKMQQGTKEKFRVHYSELVSKDFYQYIEQYMMEGPSIFLVLGGLNAVKKIRLLVGGTEPASALPGTIRGDYAHQPYGKIDDKPIRNLVHASSSLSDAQKEIDLWFSDDELFEYIQLGDDLLAF